MRLLLAIVVVLGAACFRPNPAYLGSRSDAASVPGGALDGSPDTAGTGQGPGADASLLADPPIADAAVASDGVPGSALLGYWTFEETAGETMMVRDHSGHGHDGSLENLILASARTPGKQGMALSFPAGATNPGAMVPVSSSPIRTLQTFTISAWVFRTQPPADDERGIVSRQLGTGPRQVFNLGFVDDELSLTMSSASGSENISLNSGNTKTPINTWLHVAASWNGTEVVLYLNGQRVAGTTRSWTLPDTANPLYLGTNKNDNNDEPLVGLLDEVRLYSIALTPGQIVALAAGLVP